MKKTSINIVITLISVALVGLVAIQVYWINSTIEIKEQRFTQAVHEALLTVVHKLERQEALSKINRSSAISSVLNQAGIKEEIIIEHQQRGRNSVSIRIQNQHVLKNVPSVPPSPPEPEAPEKQENLKLKKQGAIDYGEILQEKQRMVDELINGIMEERFVEPHERIDHRLLDSLIKEEFKNRGINTEYEFNVYNPIHDFIFDIDKSIAEHLLNSKFRVNLYPNDLFFDSNFLLVYFPQQSRYILETMSMMLLISAIFILIIIFAFYYSISTIVKQKKLSEIKNDFINNMTHELKTPISTISLACEALNDPDMSQSKNRVERYVDMIKHENHRLGNLVERVLQSAVIEKGELVLNKENVNIHRVIEDAIKNISLQIDKKAGEIHMNLTAPDFTISGDKMHLTNVVYNLLDNANKYTSKEPEITVSTSVVNHNLRIKVKDNGIGISKENQKKIFEKLFRVPKGNLHDVKGFGLGLSYVKAVIELHGGKIDVESELNNGSCFIIDLPI